MIIIHGDDVKKSYDRLNSLLKTFTDSGVNTYLHPASELSPTALRQELGGTDLFDAKNVEVIYGYLALNKSKTKEAITKILQENNLGEIILYEEREVPAGQLKSFPKAKVEVFKISPVIFKFLETLRPGNQTVILPSFSKIISQDTEPEFVFAMLVRQIRMLIQAKNQPDQIKTSPYAKKMFIAQSGYFTIEHLIDLHHKLYKIDKKIKTGNTSVDIGNLLYHFLQSV